jgi:hypothetical protein
VGCGFKDAGLVRHTLSTLQSGESLSITLTFEIILKQILTSNKIKKYLKKTSYLSRLKMKISQSEMFKPL